MNSEDTTLTPMTPQEVMDALQPADAQDVTMDSSARMAVALSVNRALARAHHEGATFYEVDAETHRGYSVNVLMETDGERRRELMPHPIRADEMRYAVAAMADELSKDPDADADARREIAGQAREGLRLVERLISFGEEVLHIHHDDDDGFFALVRHQDETGAVSFSWKAPLED